MKISGILGERLVLLHLIFIMVPIFLFINSTAVFTEFYAQQARDQILVYLIMFSYVLVAAGTGLPKKAKVFGEEVEQVEWEPVNSIPEGPIELTDRTIRLYTNGNSGTIEGIEILQKLITPEIKEKIVEEKKEVDFSLVEDNQVSSLIKLS